MTQKKTGVNSFFKTSAILVLFLTMAGLIVFKTGLLERRTSNSDGLSGIVSVKGTVKLDDLNLSKVEVRKINRAVAAHRATFKQVDLFLDAKDGSKDITPSTILVWAMVLETSGECEVRSWSRKTARGDLIPQMVMYMNKAAKEYEEFKRFPDVKQNFKCLYI